MDIFLKVDVKDEKSKNGQKTQQITFTGEKRFNVIDSPGIFPSQVSGLPRRFGQESLTFFGYILASNFQFLFSNNYLWIPGPGKYFN